MRAEEAGGVLRDRDAVRPHFGGMRPSAWFTRFCTSTAARSGSHADLERHGDAREARARRRGPHVLHALDAVDDLLERRRHRALHRLRVRAGVERRDGHGRRREVRIARDRQRRNRDRARENDQQRADRREDRPPDEEFAEHLATSRLRRLFLALLRRGRPRRPGWLRQAALQRRARRRQSSGCRRR